jgi:hypothetical protein
MKDQQIPTKAQLAAASRQAQRAAREAAALRANLLRRKQQARATGERPADKQETPDKCL